MKNENDTQTDGFFSEASYAEANELANTIGPILTAIHEGREPDWFSASFDTGKAKTWLLVMGDLASDYLTARMSGYLRISPLVKARDKTHASWLACMESIRGSFPAFEADVILGQNPNFTREEAEVAAFLRYSKTVDV